MRRSAEKTIQVLAFWASTALHVAAQSVTKCGDYGDPSYYNSTTLPYVFYNNPWGNDGSGFTCITVKNNGSSFDATWRWTDNPKKVHSYPHFKLDSPLYPLLITDLSSLDYSGSFGVNVTSAMNDTTAQEREQALADNDVQFNVALDMFLDANATQAEADLPGYEIMIWLSYTYDVYPVGIDTSTPNETQYVIDDTRFFLFHGNNSVGQTVHSWLPERNITAISADFSPLVHYLWQFGFIPQDLYLGTLQFGTETFHAMSEVLFRAQNYTLSMQADENQDLKPLSTVKPQSVPSQVPTMERFESIGSTVGSLRGSATLWCGIVTLLALLWS